MHTTFPTLGSTYAQATTFWDTSTQLAREKTHARRCLAKLQATGELAQFKEDMRSYGARGDVLNIDASLLDRPFLVDETVEFDGGATLHVAARRGHYGAAINLVQRGANVDRGDTMKQTALHTAAEGNHSLLTAEFLRAGADAEKRDINGQTAMHRAAFSGSADTLLALADYGADYRARDVGGLMAVHKAATMGRDEILELLLERDPEAVNIRAESGWTPLHLAAFGGHTAACAVLLSCGADPNAFDDEGKTPLHRCVTSGSDTASQVLLRGSADPNVPDRFRAMPLHIACEEGFVLVAQALLEGNAHLEVYDSLKRSALGIAAQTGNAALCEILLRYGADPFASDLSRGIQSPFVLARREGHAVVANLLESTGASGGSFQLRSEGE